MFSHDLIRLYGIRVRETEANRKTVEAMSYAARESAGFCLGNWLSSPLSVGHTTKHAKVA